MDRHGYHTHDDADGDGAIAKAMLEFGAPMRERELGDIQSNSVIEAVSRRMQDGTRTQSAQAGFAICWWSRAVQHCCAWCSIATGEHVDSPCFRMRSGQLPGMKSAFGIGVVYYRNKTNYKHQRKLESRLASGILVRHVNDPGLKWYGLQSVFDIDQVGNEQLDDNVDPDEPKGMQKQHAISKVMVEPDGFIFPLPPKHRVANLTLEGREECWNDAKPTKDELQ